MGSPPWRGGGGSHLGGRAYFLRWRIRLRIRRFFRPTLRRPFPRRRLAIRAPVLTSEFRRGPTIPGSGKVSDHTRAGPATQGSPRPGRGPPRARTGVHDMVCKTRSDGEPRRTGTVRLEMRGEVADRGVRGPSGRSIGHRTRWTPRSCPRTPLTPAFGRRTIGVQEVRARSRTARSALIWEI